MNDELSTTDDDEVTAEEIAPEAEVEHFDADGFGEEDFESQVGEELKQAKQMLAKDNSTFQGPGGAAWGAATDVVERVKPVPWLLWVMIRNVYGRSGELGDPDAQAFSMVSNLIVRAANDRTFANTRSSEDDGKGKVGLLSEAVKLIGSDVAATLCFMHAVCRRVSTSLHERVWRPILDDALLRAQIGYQVGELSYSYGAGRGMLAGFAGRAGLAVQIASGSLEDAQKALGGLASGVEIGEVCMDVYGCDPLQVAALSLIAGGCNRDIAMGIAAYNNENDRDAVVSGSEQYRWLALFSVIEKVRMGRQDDISDELWRALDYDPAAKNELFTRVQLVQRRGHGWRWVTQSLSGEDTPAGVSTKSSENTDS